MHRNYLECLRRIVVMLFKNIYTLSSLETYSYIVWGRIMKCYGEIGVIACRMRRYMRKSVNQFLISKLRISNKKNLWKPLWFVNQKNCNNEAWVEKYRFSIKMVPYVTPCIDRHQVGWDITSFIPIYLQVQLTLEIKLRRSNFYLHIKRLFPSTWLKHHVNSFW